MGPLDISRPLVKLVLEYGKGECDIQLVDAELKKHERVHGVELRAGDTSMAITGYSSIPELDGAVWDQYVTGDFYRFLDETHAVMHGMFVSDSCHVLLGGKYTLTASARAWGQIYAEWANRVNWLGSRNWTYAPLYTGSISKEVDEWMESFYDFLKNRDPA